ncbi:MAG: hypothetical protein M0Z41_09305 [Peptococcaceae bacterium]|nr:hypothetical protein [Peptococcaceae bacterium]
MQDLILSKTLPLTATRQDLDRAGGEMAAVLARELGRRRASYRELYLEATAEDGETGASRLFPRPQGPEKIPWHIRGLLAGLPVTSPLTGLTVRLGGCSPAALEQLTFTGMTVDPLKRALEKVNPVHGVVPLSSLAADRREEMLSFYDPFRQRI